MSLTKTFGMAGLGASLLATGALFLGGSAGAAALDSNESDRAAALASSAVLGPTVTVAPNTNGIASATCPAGTTATGGGLITTGIRLFVTDSFKSGNGWAVRVTNTGGLSDSVRAEAICS